METGTILALVAVSSFLVALMGFLAAQYWNLKKINIIITRELEDKVENLQKQCSEHRSKFDLIEQKMGTTALALEKLESTVTAKLSKMDDKMDKILSYLYKKES